MRGRLWPHVWCRGRREGHLGCFNVCGGPRCKRNKMLQKAFAVEDELDLIGELVNEKITIRSDVTIRNDLIKYRAETI